MNQPASNTETENVGGDLSSLCESLDKEEIDTLILSEAILLITVLPLTGNHW